MHARGGAARAPPSLLCLRAHLTRRCHLKHGAQGVHALHRHRTISSGTDWRRPSSTPPALLDHPSPFTFTTPPPPPLRCSSPPPSSTLSPHFLLPRPPNKRVAAMSCSSPPQPPVVRPSVRNALAMCVSKRCAKAPPAAVARHAKLLAVIVVVTPGGRHRGDKGGRGRGCRVEVAVAVQAAAAAKRTRPPVSRRVHSLCGRCAVGLLATHHDPL